MGIGLHSQADQHTSAGGRETEQCVLSFSAVQVMPNEENDGQLCSELLASCSPTQPADLEERPALAGLVSADGISAL